MSSSGSDFHLLAKLAEEFLAQIRRGEKPDLGAYCARYPDIARELKDLIEMQLTLERVRADGSESTTQDYVKPSDGPPPMIGEFRILEKIGEGGMGTVYKAVQESLGRQVALKILPLHLAANETFVRRFMQEAKGAAQLHHTNIVPVFAMGFEQDRHYIAMQLIQGQSLDKVLKELNQPNQNKRELAVIHSASGELSLPLAGTACPGSTSTKIAELSKPETTGLTASLSELRNNGGPYWRKVADLGRQAASALNYAHLHGVIHRDIKPGNLLLDLHGTVWISDFGVAKLVDIEADISNTGDILGTIRYMPPEQLRGKAVAQSDQFSLGLTLYEFLTLRQAYDAKSRQHLVRQVETVALLEPRKINPSIPRDLETIVLKSLQRDSASRYSNAQAMADDLQRFIEDRPILARRMSSFEKAYRWCLRNPAISSVSFLAILLSVVLILVRFAHGFQLEAAKGREELAQLQAKFESKNGINQRYYRILSDIREGSIRNNPGWTWKNLTLIRDLVQLNSEARDLVELRSEAAVALGAHDAREIGQFAEGIKTVSCLAFHPKAEIAAVGEHDPENLMSPTVWLIDTRTLQLRRKLSLFSPVLPNFLRAKKEGILTAKKNGFSAVGFSDDGSWLLAGTRFGELVRWDLRTPEQPPTVIQAHPEGILPFTFTPDRRSYFTFCSGAHPNNEIKRWNTATGNLEATSRPFSGIGRLACVSQEELFVQKSENKWTILDARSLQPHPRIWSFLENTLEFAPNQEFVLGADEHRGMCLFNYRNNLLSQWLWTDHGMQLHPSHWNAARFSKNSDILFALNIQGEYIQAWQTANGRPLYRFPVSRSRTWPTLEIDPDSRYFAYGENTSGRMYELSQRHIQTFFAHHDWHINEFCIDPVNQSVICLTYHYPVPRTEMCRWSLKERHSGRPTARQGLGGAWEGLEVSPANGASAVFKRTSEEIIEIRESGNSEPRATIPIPSDLRSLRFLPGGRILALRGKELLLYDPARAYQAVSWADSLQNVLGRGAPFTALTTCSKWIATGNRNGSLKLLPHNPGLWHQGFAVDLDSGDSIRSLCFTDDNSGLLVGTSQGHLHRIATENMSVLSNQSMAHRGAISGIIILSPTIAITSGQDNDLKFWRINGGRFEELFHIRLSGQVKKIELTPDRTELLVLVEYEHALRSWNLKRLFAALEEMGLGLDRR